MDILNPRLFFRYTAKEERNPSVTGWVNSCAGPPAGFFHIISNCCRGATSHPPTITQEEENVEKGIFKKKKTHFLPSSYFLYTASTLLGLPSVPVNLWGMCDIKFWVSGSGN